MYLVIFPEGTRYNPELQKVISASQAFACKEGMDLFVLYKYSIHTFKFPVQHY